MVVRKVKILGSALKLTKIENFKKVKKWSKVFRKKTNFQPKSLKETHKYELREVELGFLQSFSGGRPIKPEKILELQKKSQC